MSQNQIILSNERLEIVLEEEGRAGIVLLKDRKTGQNFISDLIKGGELYVLEFMSENGVIIRINSQDFRGCSSNVKFSTKVKELFINFEGHQRYEVDVQCQVRLEKNSEISQWRIQVNNASSLKLCKIYYPVIVARCPLEPKPSKTAKEFLLVPYVDNGCLFVNPLDFLPPYFSPLGKKMSPPVGIYEFRHPGINTVQMMAFYNDVAGLYLATYDTSGYCKSFSPTRRIEGLDLSIEHYVEEIPGQITSLLYDTIVGVFQGDWRTGADIYKKWAYKQPMCAKRLDQRKDIPEWYKKAPVVITYRTRGKADFDPNAVPNTDYHPPSKVPPIIRKYSKALSCSVIAVAMQWEKHGPWIGPDYFPPFQGEEPFKQAIKQMHRDRNYFCLYIQPLWHYRSKNTDYKDYSRFQKESKECIALDITGCPDVHSRGESDAATLCIGSSKAKEILRDSIMGCFNLGADIVQIDAILGFQANKCYSKEHNHSLGIGKWMHEHIFNFLNEIQKQAAREKEEFLFSTEGAPCELYIPLLGTYDSRRDFFPTSITQQNVPLFNYIYHPYILGFAGLGYPDIDAPEGLFLKAAQIITEGFFINLVLGQRGKMTLGLNKSYDPAPCQAEALKFIKLCIQAQRDYARDYLIFGEILRPVAMGNVPTLKFKANFNPWPFREGEEIHSIEVPAVFHSSWRVGPQNIGHILANYTGDYQEPILKLVNYNSSIMPLRVQCISIKGTEVIAEKMLLPQKVKVKMEPRSIMLIEQLQRISAKGIPN